MFCKRMATIHKKGKERLEELREEHRAETERLVSVLGRVLAAAREAVGPPEPDGDAEPAGTMAPVKRRKPEPVKVINERAGRLVLKQLEQAGGLDALAAAHEAVSAHHGNNYLPLLEKYYKSHRAALFTLLDTVVLEPTSADRSVLDAVEFVRANSHRSGEHIPAKITVDSTDAQGAPIRVTLAIDVDAFAGENWRKILRIKDRPGRLVRRHLEVCVFSYLAAELRSGDIAIVGADSFANLYAQLMSWEKCEPLVDKFCGQAGIPTQAAELTAFYKKELTDIADAVDAGFPENTDLRFENGRPVLTRRKGADRRPSALALEEAVHDRLPERGLLDILARTAHEVGWTRHFGPASGSDPKIRDAMARYVLMTFANGTLLGPSQVARHMPR